MIDTNLSVDFRILRIVEVDLKLLDCSKNLLYEHELQEPLQISNTENWLKIQVDLIFIEQPVLS